MAPLVHNLGHSSHTDAFLAFLIGIGFGFFLEQGGFGNAVKLAKTFYFKDMTVLKVMFTAIIVAMTGLIFMDQFHMIDLSLIWINPTYLWPGIVGGLIMGVGFIVGGYCPGTGIVGLVTLKVDALFNILGALVGMAITAEIIPFIYEWWTGSLIGKRITIPEYFDISPGIVGFLIILIALGLFVFSEVMEKRSGHKE
ncbi:MAG: sulfurtransferase [Epsilonproteobacteria bacterium]|nr:MAG: sulfurtransferase [Campylobacterota bacterium]RLA66938.1 MAG: sulfurtransferase [Campylobacterota bacterium]